MGISAALNAFNKEIFFVTPLLTTGNTSVEEGEEFKVKSDIFVSAYFYLLSTPINQPSGTI